MKNRQKLELTWIGKDDQPKLEPRILIEDPEKSYGDKNSENMLIFGDNLLALKALEQDFAGKVMCISIDPPYNTGNAFEHYDDGLEHSLWLSLMKPHLELLRALLSDNGSLWISIDDDESHYLKVLCDEIFGRRNFVANVIWHKKHTRANDAKWLSDNHDHILIYAKNKENWRPNMLPRTEDMDSKFKNPDQDPRGSWSSQPIQVKTPSESCIYEIENPAGKKIWPPKGRSWQFQKKRYLELVADNRIWFGKNGTNVPRIKKFLSEVQDGLVATTIWPHHEVGHNQEAKAEMKQLFPDTFFDTPKPERLIQRILILASNHGDLVLDSFLGSGTTAAVAHKMGRKWIGIELGEHCHTHCLPRLKQVCDGTDQGGISKSVNWKGGGGFKYYYLAPSLLKEDKHGNWVIDERYNADMLAAAMSKHEGFKYNPDEEIYWKQGQSTEKDFIFTTTQFVTVETLDKIREDMKPGESLLICCKSFQKACENQHSEITVKKIPGMLLGRCEFGRDDYSFNIVTMPVDPDAPDFVPPGPGKETTGKKNAMEQGKLF
ncbi:MAG: site-specific DNA-methyltransferase [Proteobacteria bacterium]|nr:site-specific DNA-methyltransferase [Pseudomonadota bacterium]MBU4258336.1 site-specific DNA-methyltransferase [Pseudomonadota bacterium]MBU4286631.1 site-specific DNA-methyltransferase [Pseudomonadota bacterium]MBU4414060.1 site-specific DNA-methyltransferase [Pseudomonadota bacterium]